MAGRHYAIGRNLTIPFNPGFVYGVGGKLYFSWLSFWKMNPLAGEQLSLFVTLVDEMLLQDSDLEAAEFNILDFSANQSGAHRRLDVVNAADVPRISEARKAEMLETFVEGLERATAQIAAISKQRPDDRAEAPAFDDSQLRFDLKR